MKVIFSRKGFDSGYGGVASPIFPDGSMVSLPIPGYSKTRFSDIQCNDKNMANIVSQLTKGKIRGTSPVHFDPDLNSKSLERIDGWLPSLGQTGAAQGHLDTQKVNKGDIFLFFGWFRQAEQIEKDGIQTWRFVPGAPDIHVLFGYLQIGNLLRIGGTPNTEKLLESYPWLEGHAHLWGARDENNTIHVASDKLTLDNILLNLPGGGAFNKFSQDLVLTAPNQKSRSLWKVPAWLPTPESGIKLSYHTDPTRWTKNEIGDRLLQSVAKGQEFVIDCENIKELTPWLEQLISNHLIVDQKKTFKI